MNSLFITGQRGLGDNIYARPFIRAAAKRYDRVEYETPWPEVFEDLPVNIVRPVTKLRTQAKNVALNSFRWSQRTAAKEVQLGYGHSALVNHGSITKALEAILPLGQEPFVFDLPVYDRPPYRRERPIAVVRPVTVRREWSAPARNPLPQYIALIASALMQTHWVVSIADLAPGEEWIEGEAPPAHESFHRGELRIRDLITLIRGADIVVGGVGWIVPASIACGTKAFIVLGGLGAHNAPHIITDPRMDLKNITFASPKEFCRCSQKQHTCRKTIPDLSQQWNRFATSHRSLPTLQETS